MKKLIFGTVLLVAPSIAAATTPTLTVTSCTSASVTYSYTASSAPGIEASNNSDRSQVGTVVAAIQESAATGTNRVKDFAAEWGGSSNEDLWITLVDGSNYVTVQCPD
ncbi:MAG: hypothetical protein ACON4W_02905 [Parvibaculales bacterium]